ncbi:MAG: DNA cytosine methyltransferase [Burkholderiales bacterium]|nr:DNA cytosine methyltransferase [Burkholderiales bacterium]
MPPTPVIDLFSGPGGLGEGFSSLDEGKAFRIVVSAEMESSARETLRLRSFYRLLRGQWGDAGSYYRYCNGEAATPYDETSKKLWEQAGQEALQLTLGNARDNETLDKLLDDRLKSGDECVLIGGPPCQAYSLAGRSRNAGIPEYLPEKDPRHFLYREYLRIIQTRQPAVFVMENVKGILSSSVGGRQIFQDILRDLSNPGAALEPACPSKRYRIHSLVNTNHFEEGMDLVAFDPRDFIIRAEKYGIPQARHRVILLGIREDISGRFELLREEDSVSVREVIAELPKLRSRISRRKDTGMEWGILVRNLMSRLAEEATLKKQTELADALLELATSVNETLTFGALRMPMQNALHSHGILNWYHDANLKVWLNHEARSHMPSDLGRYGYAAAYAKAFGVCPKGHEQFSLDGLRPNHENWETGKFADRFKVQRWNSPSTTITSHISKDGHYFIHPDPAQCRSLTVREAARLQTFPDNYFFMGNRTQQYQQVGNAVPPLLAYKIARIVREILHGGKAGLIL